jgi:hypothetical protein
MSSEIIQTLEALLSLGISFVCVCLSKYRYQENEKYAVKYENNAKMLIIRWIITEIFKWGSKSYCNLCMCILYYLYHISHIAGRR